MLTLYVDQRRWRSHLDAVATAHPGLVPVAKGNGYGFGNRCLAGLAAELGADTVATGTYAEVEGVLDAFPGSVLVLSPWRPFESRAVYGERVVHTMGRLEDLRALSREADRTGTDRPSVVVELMTSMRRHGFSAHGLREAADHLDGLRVQGFALHLPLPLAHRAHRAHRSHLDEADRLLSDLVASGVPTRRVYVSHLTDDELAGLRTAYGELELRPRVGTQLWLGDRAALSVRSTVLDVHEVARGDVYGYRGRSAPGPGWIVIASGGTAHGIGLEAPTGAASLRDRAARLAKGGLDAAGFVRSPFSIDGKQRLFAEPPHLQVSMLFLPAGARVPDVGSEVDVQVRFTATTFDQTVFR